jgi:CrcB protein
MEKISLYLLIGLGSALGGVGRFWLSGVIAERFGDRFPWGTILVNVSGSFAIGLFAALAAPDSRFLIPPRWSYFFMAGVCGGYTTFSSFSLQTVNLLRVGQWAYAGGNVLVSVSLCLLAVGLGYLAGQVLSR